MWIIVEGSTCSGKSTLERQLASKLRGHDDLIRVHMDRPAELTRRWVLKEYAIKWERWKPTDGPILADRWAWGEATYSPIYRPDTNKDGFGLLGVAGWRWVELFLQSRGALTVLLRAEADTLIGRYMQRGDDHVKNRAELIQVAKLYDAVYLDASSSTQIRDTSRTQLDEHENYAGEVIELATRAAEDANLIREWQGYIGRPNPSALLVGDTRNVTKKYGNETKLPFMPVNGNSGDFLLRSLPDHLWSNVGIVNAGEYPATLRRLWSTLGSPPVVALGERASEALDRQRVPYARVPHPQYARRFEHRDIDKYGLSIEGAIKRQES
jgi:hypothetical protein